MKLRSAFVDKSKAARKATCAWCGSEATAAKGPCVAPPLSRIASAARAMDTGCSPWRLALRSGRATRVQGTPSITTMSRDLARDKLEGRRREDAFAHPCLTMSTSCLCSYGLNTTVPCRDASSELRGMSPKKARRGTSIAFATPTRASVDVSLVASP